MLKLSKLLLASSCLAVTIACSAINVSNILEPAGSNTGSAGTITFNTWSGTALTNATYRFYNTNNCSGQYGPVASGTITPAFTPAAQQYNFSATGITQILNNSRGTAPLADFQSFDVIFTTGGPDGISGPNGSANECVCFQIACTGGLCTGTTAQTGISYIEPACLR